MAYSEFNFIKAIKEFGLMEQRLNLFEQIRSIEPSSWLREALDIGLQLALTSSGSSEKARSEFIVAPVLMELERQNHGQLALYSGERLDVDIEKGLVGECDFILSKGPLSPAIQVPILALVEAKKNDIGLGLGQCIAQMLGAQLFNQRENHTNLAMFGCVTTGENWQFLKLLKNTVYIDIKRYYINQIEVLLGILQQIVELE